MESCEVTSKQRQRRHFVGYLPGEQYTDSVTLEVARDDIDLSVSVDVTEIQSPRTWSTSCQRARSESTAPVTEHYAHAITCCGNHIYVSITVDVGDRRTESFITKIEW